ncbi:MAG: glycosyltransferase family 39 protein [Planctomycetota bacterium]|jgi:4-amino-4-deoxy-L-arabinose transferase-like glycosyltransferase
MQEAGIVENRPWGTLWRIVAAPLTVFVICGLLRVGLLERHGLWADEFFSLAMATGHSLEHPADKADPAQGDYVELPEPVSPAAYSRYLEHEDPPAGPGRVMRAITLSGTSPPLYNLLLYAWTRALGTSDAVLRLFSVLLALACFPVLWSLARDVGGKSAALPTVVLFTFSPLCVFYSTEGRMYSLLLLCTASTLWLTLKLWRQGFSTRLFLPWVAAVVAGLLTHYFFVFVWVAAFGWLMVQPGACSRKAWLVGAVLIGLLVCPWYVRIPESMSAWRVTSYWLHLEPSGYSPVLAHLLLPWSFFSVHGPSGAAVRWDWIIGAILLLLAVLAWREISWGLFSPPRTLLWFWVLGACLGPAALDLLRGTYTVAIPRYAIAGMPAAFVLVGLGAGRLRPLTRAVLLLLIVLVCMVGVRRIYLNDSRAASPYRQVSSLVAKQARPTDLIIVHSIPSGVAGIARYLESSGGCPEGVGFASWVGQLGQRRVPQDLLKLAVGRRRIIVVEIHAVGEPASQVAWLSENAKLEAEKRVQMATVSVFTPRVGEYF